MFERPEDDLTFLRVHDDVTGELGNSRGDQRRLRRGEPELKHVGSSTLTSRHDVPFRRDDHRLNGGIQRSSNRSWVHVSPTFRKRENLRGMKLFQFEFG